MMMYVLLPPDADSSLNLQDPIHVCIYIYAYMICVNNNDTITTTTTTTNNSNNNNVDHVMVMLPSTRDLCLQCWVFITGGCSGRGVQWMGVVLYDKLVNNII